MYEDQGLLLTTIARWLEGGDILQLGKVKLLYKRKKRNVPQSKYSINHDKHWPSTCTNLKKKKKNVLHLNFGSC